ncbi:MAG TPA: DUF5335 family protein [Actinomycetota bacterium]|nr:DUF5335 family protein [Actinomycetota bacterium]
MSQQTRQPVRQEWRGFLDAVSRDQEGRPVTIEVMSSEIGGQIEADRLPLNFIQYDEKDEVFIVSVRKRDADEPALDHIVENPWKILFEPPTPEAVRAIDVEGADGVHTLVTLHGREVTAEGG